MTATLVRGSFRDPSGFVFRKDSKVFRQVNRVFAEEFDACVSEGLYDDLIDAGLLIPHRVVQEGWDDNESHAILEPDVVPFISYPYEWCFSQLKEAALVTLEAQHQALKRGFTLRDATAFNVQFVAGRPILIDTLSFERHKPGEPWVAYKQFCEHFLAPLALMSACDIRLSRLQRFNLDGIPLDLASRMLPGRTWVKLGLLLHVHLHARAMRKYENHEVAATRGNRSVSTKALLALVDSLRNTVQSLTWEPSGTQWANYENDHNYSDAGVEAKKHLVQVFADRTGATTIWDLGGNTGNFSRQVVAPDRYVVCFDVDPAAVELNFRRLRTNEESGLMPLQFDLMNPSPNIGWANEERMSLEQRGPVDLVMALALVHHLAIANNVPLERVAEAFQRLGRYLIIEFVPKSDSQVKRLLANRVDIFPGYTQVGFEKAFATHFKVLDRQRVGDSERMLYLMQGLAQLQ